MRGLLNKKDLIISLRKLILAAMLVSAMSIANAGTGKIDQCPKVSNIMEFVITSRSYNSISFQGNNKDGKSFASKWYDCSTCEAKVNQISEEYTTYNAPTLSCVYET